ncbi:PEP-CTERM sorting domain-containing protein [Haloferula sp.]|uniref:PEP-CTERM sorting domain-containing protein n=1 Tax=Haloferula sp. TaxID=2497595 RepID=UPI0032A08539
MYSPFLNHRGLILGLFALSFLAAETVQSQTLTGEVNAYDHTDYAGTASHFSLGNARVEGEFLFEGDVVIFCSDIAARSIDRDIDTYPYTLTEDNSPITMGLIEDFDVWSRYSNTQDEAVAQAQAHWLVNNFYESYFVNTPAGETHARQYAFQNALWEIMGDGGTDEGLNFTNGNINRSKFSTGGSSEAPELWAHMNILIDAVNAANVESGYKSQFQIFAALDSRDGYQDYFALASTVEPMLVPEPSSSGLILFSLGLMIARRRRN